MSTLFRRVGILIFALSFVMSPRLVAQSNLPFSLSDLQGKPAAEKPLEKALPRQGSYSIEVSGKEHWLDTKIDLQPGDKVSFSAEGKVTCPMASQDAGPAGLPRAWKDLLRILPVNSAGRGALIGRIGTADIGQPFLVGEQLDLVVRQAGRLFLTVNQPANEEATGSFKVKIKLVAAPTTAKLSPAGVANTDMSAVVPNDLLAKIPRRVIDPQGNEGDMVNFMIVGSDDQVESVFQSAGWVKVDKTTKDAVLHGLISSISKQAYVEMPMSILTLFGRPQDYGYAHADPLTVVSTRHHLRLWKSPFTVQGQTLWVGAGTHDIGFERDERNNGVTHKIDPAIDGERDFIASSLNSTGMLSKLGYVTPANPLKEARTATGGSFHSDGRILVMELTPSGGDRRTDFAKVFCSVLQQERPDGGDWAPCSQYMDGAPSEASSTEALPTLSRDYRLLILPGFMNSCASGVPAMQKGQQHLKDAHGIDVEYLTLPNESSETNGKIIADYLNSHSKLDKRKYIVIGYSKGAPDFQVAMADHPDAASAVAGFVSLAGAIGGSPVADTMPAMIQKYTKTLNFGSCQGDFSNAFKSLRRDVRRNFQLGHPDPIVPSYSIVAMSDKTNTSKMLLQAWQILSVYDPEEDSQVTRQDALVPGSTYLGAAKADHLAIALGFEDSSDGNIKSVMDHNHYPRAALLEAIYRFVSADLANGKK